MNVKWIALTVVLAVVVAAAAGYGGYTLGNQAGRTQAANVRSTFQAERGFGGSQAGAAGTGQGFTGGAGFQGAGGTSGQGTGGAQVGQFNAGNFASGQVKQIDGDTIQLSTATEVLTVKVTDQTQIQKTDQGTVSDLQPGERVTVQGARGTDGTLTAQMIQIGGGGFGGGARGGAGAPQTRATPAP